jgi:hypothetical protein
VVAGVSRRTQRAIDAVVPGDVAAALERYRWFIRQPGRWLYLPPPYLLSWHVVDARDALERALSSLPPGPRRELYRVVSGLDDEFERRTLPDPKARVDLWAGEAWWRCRLNE